jgi:hypothetical protein
MDEIYLILIGLIHQLFLLDSKEEKTNLNDNNK